MTNSIQHKILLISAIFGALAVVAGAFGAHALAERIPSTSLEVWKTAVLYQFIHVLAILSLKAHVRTILYWFSGILLFSGSLYVLSTSGLHSVNLSWLGPVTPIGGLLFILGWLSYVRELWQDKAKTMARHKKTF